MNARETLDQIAHQDRESIVLLTAHHSGVFEALGHERLDAPTLARRLNHDPRALDIVLCALAAMGLLERHGEQFAIVDDYKPLVLPESEQTQYSILNHNYNCLRRWARLDEVLTSGQPVARPARDAESLRHFICGMADISRRSSADVVDAIDLSPYRRMLDRGGGPATSSIVFASRHHTLHAVVFDLPEPIQIANEQIARAQLTDRIQTRAGDFLTDDIGHGYDLIYISNIIHSHSIEQTRLIFEKSANALNPGGAIMVKDFFLNADRTEPASAALFSVNMLVGTEAGKSYTWDQTEALLAEKGFERFERAPVATASGVLIGHKPR